MDTPERNQIRTPISKFEDSPVFNYINSLSPIKPVKSVHITQTFNPLGFPSPPSVFTSPHVSCLKESRFLRRNNLFDPSKPKVLSKDVNKTSSSEGEVIESIRQLNNSSEFPNNTDEGIFIGDNSTEPSSENAKLAIEGPQALKYGCGSPGYDRALCGDETNPLLELPVESPSDVTYVEVFRKDSTESEVHLQGMYELESKTDDWECLIPDATDLLNFNSPNHTEAFKALMQKSLDPTVRYCNSMSQLTHSDINNGRQLHVVHPVASGSEHDVEDHPSQPGAATGTDKSQDNLINADQMASSPNEKNDNELVSIAYRGMRRRCLDFEMAGTRMKNSGNSSNTGSTVSDEMNVASDKQLLPGKRSADSQRCILPGIGLHLNALATLKDYKSIKNDNLLSGRQLNLPGSSSLLQISTSQGHHLLSISASSERDLDTQENGVQPTEDCSQASAYLVGEDFNQNSPKKKRRKEPAGEGEACKRCNCKKSKCLKLYCECFAAGVYCIGPCSCQDCFNKPIHEDTVLATRKQIESRNPLAFAPKVVRSSSDSVPEIGDDTNKTPASARHKRGCNCKKSSCLKKYCECYQGGVGCSISCRCEGCKNAYGRKDGSVPIEIEGELEEEIEGCEKAVAETAPQKPEIQNNEDHPESAHPTTPLCISRPLVPLPFSSKGKPPRSSFITTISASSLYSSQTFRKPNILRSQPRFEKHFQTVPDIEMPEVLRGDSSPATCIKMSSPNGKRISSPNCKFGSSSPSRRSSRKLILQSIPSFPSLSSHH